MRVYEAVVDELVRHGVRHVFGLMGEETAKLLTLLPDRGISYLSSRHDAGAVGMADGYARVSGGIGVAVVSRGPGLTNSLTALTTAGRGGSRVLVLAADTADSVPKIASVAQTARFNHKYIDQCALLEAVGVAHMSLHAPSSVVAALRRAITYVTACHTVVVNMPADLIDARTDSGLDGRAGELPVIDDPVAPSRQEIEHVADLLETKWAARYPVILAGRGSVRANSGDTLRALGIRTGALMATTLQAVSMFRGEPFNAGIMGSFSTPVGSELLGRVDLLLSFGASLGPMTTDYNRICPKARIVQFDADRSAFGRFAEPTLTVAGDVGLAAMALVDELRQRGHVHDGYRTDATAAKLAAFRPESTFSDRSDSEGMDPRSLALALNEILPREFVLVVDSGHHIAFQFPYLDVVDPASAVLPLDFGAIGVGASLAIGAAIAQQGRLTVLGAGDGGLMMSICELDTAVRARVPLLIIVFNDSAFGAEVQFLDVNGLPTQLARFDQRSFAAIASAMGAEGMVVESLRDIVRVKQRLDQGLSGPLLLDCRITTAVRADFVSSMALKAR